MRKSNTHDQVIKRMTDNAEISDTLRAVEEGRKEYKEGKTIKAKSLADLFKINKRR